MLTTADRVADLAAAFELNPGDLTAVAITDWAAQTPIGGSYELAQLSSRRAL